MTCKCHKYGYTTDMTFAEVSKLVKNGDYCTSLKHSSAGYQCPTIVRHMNSQRTVEDRRAYYNKKLKKQGFTDEQIAEMPRKGRTPKTFESTKTFSFENFTDKKTGKPKRRRIRASA